MQVFRLSQNEYKNCSLLTKLLVGGINPKIVVGAAPPDVARSARTSLTPRALAGSDLLQNKSVLGAPLITT